MHSSALSTALKDPVQLLKDLQIKPERYWIRRGEKRALLLFHQMAKRVPAYKDFLKKNNIHPQTIKTIQDFKQIPTIDKDNYLRQYPHEALCWDGKFKQKRWTISATSGSTGEPYYFPREIDQDYQYAVTAELYLRNNFDIHKKSTLYINGFGMGIWIGGVFTYQAIKLAAQRGNYNLSIITPGSSKEEIIKAIKYLGSKFDQIIIGGYPPLVKDTIDDGIRQGINWKQYDLKFIFSAEGFSETFRDYIIEKTGLKNPYKDTLNHYGIVDIGTAAHETPFSILLRRIALRDESLHTKLFSIKNKLPTCTQFLPELFFFEEVNRGIICSCFSGLPLVRYDLKDNGGIISLQQVKKILQEKDIDLQKEIIQANIENTLWNLPFVYIFERRDFTVKLSGANIYPEEIKKALQHTFLQTYVTGKFTMVTKHDKNQDQYLEINIEKKPNSVISSYTKKKFLNSIIHQLLISNSEYAYLYKHLPRQRITPRLVFWDYEHPTFFMPGGKQKWVKKA